MKKIVVGMSGGVDSTTAAAILAEQGYDVVGVGMRLFSANDTSSCCGISNMDDARRAAEKIGIPFYLIDYQKEFKEKVIDYFIDSYIKAETPNPCIACNNHLKFGYMLEFAKSIGAEFVATGHYAVVEKDPVTDRFLLKKGADKNKDQSYFLYGLDQHQLSHTVFPLGTLTKNRTREIAKEFGLKVHSKPGSQDICFIEKDYKDFIIANSPYSQKPGRMIHRNGKILGTHKGLAFYTIGQRKGLGISSREPLYVIKLDVKNNEVIVGDEASLYFKEVILKDLNWIGFEKLNKKIIIMCKARYRQKDFEASVEPIKNSDKINVMFKNPQKFIAPGQAMVFYDNNTVIGGGTIEKIVP